MYWDLKQINKCDHCNNRKATILYQYRGFSSITRLLCKECYEELRRTKSLHRWIV